MKKILAILTLAILTLSLILAVGSDNSQQQAGSEDESNGENVNVDVNGQIIGGERDEHGCLTAGGYSWNESEQKCVKEWSQGEDRYQNMEQNRIQDGTHMGENGKSFMIQTQENNRIKLESNGVSVECDCNMTQEQDQNRTKLKVHLSNGMNSEIKIMPDTASETALERLRLKVCSTENNCTMQLKEVGQGNETKLTYELKTERKTKFLGLFGSKMQVKAQIDAENGEVVDVNKPWWAFLASEPQEE